MITIHFHTIEERLEKQKSDRSNIRFVIGKTSVAANVESSIPQAVIERVRKENKDDLEKQLWIEFDALKVDRNKLSSQIWKMVENGATQSELKAHYELIESYRPALMTLYDKINHVKQYGALPADPEPEEENLDPYYLKDRKKKLVDKRCKLRTKLKTSANPSKPAKILEWEQELAQADIEYSEVVEKLKQVEGKG